MRLTLLLLLMLGVAVMMPIHTTQAAPETASRVVPPIEFQTATQSRSARDVMRGDGWQTLPGETPNFGYDKTPYWFRFQAPAGDAQRILEISYPHLDALNIYLFRNGELVRELDTGDRRPFDSRAIAHPHFLFPFDTRAGQDSTLLLRVETRGALQVPVTIWERTAYFGHSRNADQIHALYYGILATVSFLNLLVFLALRERTYLYYSLATSGYLFLVASLRGATYPVFWPDTPWAHNQAILLAVPLVVLFASLFARAFLKLAERSRVLNGLVLMAIAGSVTAGLGTFVLDYNTSIRLSVALAIPSFLLLAAIGPIEWFRGNRQAGLYTIAWGALTVGTALTALNKYGLLASSFVTEYGMQIGSAFEAILLTVALAARLYQEREDRIRARESQLDAMAARHEAELKLMDQALHDPLSGLPNRTAFELALQESLSERPNDQLAVGVIQLTNLQAVTRTLGHRNTDRVLELVARRFNGVLRDLPGIYPVERRERQPFYVASLDPASFGFMADARRPLETPRMIIQCLDAIREPIEYLGMRLPLNPLAGVAVYPTHSDDTNTLVRQAYVALESDQARDRGLAYYRADQDSYSADRLTMVAELREALAQNELALYLQPKLSLTSRRVVGAEALIRWPGRDKPVPADQIISVAERTGLIKPLTRWVLETALTLRTRLVEAGHDLALSVNVSPNNLREPDFPVFVQRLMTAHPEHRNRLMLEVTETSMMLDPANSLRALRALASAGIPVAIDDFGSGYSSLSYIKQLPATEVKVDRSLVTDLRSQPEDRVIVQTTINMCHDLGYQVVAEGVEDQATLELLSRMDCDMIQGYVLVPPRPIDAFVEWLDAPERARQA
ncbi:EAL domain-containing protein (putative c-di-GMP-specific phosphodiesterase class I) [Tamilnaduibacter salinus]|uniref:EAL domain-containing protein (Putative c-di-GMP-specific phosphodiesterase class I) n=1 Tax=Tamilnaduibacter salinus TaxID=1484056 RepID=A0A2U1CWP6_9GAMM|nr:EAL domain-containing protein [Tamilnaduibacter salinus]PVY76354.1 EAL domain-containing protein (putative c-di-GMP-specific phosphodiesterase class I) [Tamilnaduibacter salinus]